MRMLMLPILAALLLSAADCPRAAAIEAPADGSAQAPIREFRVRFHRDFRAGTFSATLDGEDVTRHFQPAPTPGGVSIWHDPALHPGRAMLVVKGGYTASGLDFRTLGDTAVFFPLTAGVVTAGTLQRGLTLREGQTAEADAILFEVPVTPTTVTITVAGDRAVSLNGQPVGMGVSLTVPTNDRRARFTVRGVRVGRAELHAAVPGYATEAAGIQVANP